MSKTTPRCKRTVHFTWNDELGVPTWNLTPGVKGTCIGASDYCRKECYTGADCPKGNWMYDNGTVSRDRNWQSIEDLPRWIDDCVAEVRYWASKGHKRIRIHSSGDFFSVDYFLAWLDVACQCPDTEFFTYTRTWRVPHMRLHLSLAESVPNFSLWYSTDPSTEIPNAPRVSYILDKTHGIYDPSMPAPNCDKQIMKGKANCATCGKCFHRTQTAVTFIKH